MFLIKQQQGEVGCDFAFCHGSQRQNHRVKTGLKRCDETEFDIDVFSLQVSWSSDVLYPRASAATFQIHLFIGRGRGFGALSYLTWAMFGGFVRRLRTWCLTLKALVTQHLLWKASFIYLFFLHIHILHSFCGEYHWYCHALTLCYLLHHLCMYKCVRCTHVGK